MRWVIGAALLAAAAPAQAETFCEAWQTMLDQRWPQGTVFVAPSMATVRMRDRMATINDGFDDVVAGLDQAVEIERQIVTLENELFATLDAITKARCPDLPTE